MSSVLDQFRDAEQRVAQRLKELEPAVAEYRELADVAKRLGIDVEAASQAVKPARPARRRSRGRAPQASAKAATTQRSSRAARKARPGKRTEQLVDLVRARPGITVREAGAELGVDPTSLYRIVRRLEQGGTLRKDGRGLEVVGTPA